jgi:DNA-binding XRE family transcriptional regulator
MEYSVNEYAIYAYRSQYGILVMSSKRKIDLLAIGLRIKKLRATMLQEELAAYLDVSQGHLSKIERGKIAPSLEMLVLLSDKFRKSVDWILRGDGN